MCLTPSTTATTAAISKSDWNGTIIEVMLAPIARPPRTFATTAGIVINIAGTLAVAAKVKSPPIRATIAINSDGPTV